MTGTSVTRASLAFEQARYHNIFLVLILGIAVALRLHGLFHDLPFSYFGDEAHLVKRSMALGTGDLNPHWFHKPALLMYLLALCYGIYFALGWLVGEFSSVDAFGAHFLTDMGPFLLIGRLVVAAFGIATVYVTYAIGRKAFGRTEGLVAALLAAVLLPMMTGSQVVKEDGPAGFFLALAVYFFLRTRDTPSLWPLLAASLLAGLSMATKYYGIILVPVFVLAELARRFTVEAPLRTVLWRCLLVGTAFIGAFFVASPYNFLDPMWAQSLVDQLYAFVSPEPVAAYDPDHKITYDPGIGAVPGAFVHFVEQVLRPDALGMPTGVLVGLGFLATILPQRTRWHALIIASPALVFAICAVVMAPYHVAPRHLNAIYPLLCTFVLPGASLVTRVARLPGHWAAAAAVALVCIAAAPTLVLGVKDNVAKMRPDSRTAAYDWIVQSLPRDARILVDDYGPILQPNPTAVARLQRHLAGLPEGEAFTEHQSVRLDLLRRFPPPGGFDIEELGHQWWLPQEISAEELRNSAAHRDMGNPLTNRIPEPLKNYRAAGFGFIITNSTAKGLYAKPKRKAAFPSFARFYAELDGLTPIRTFDPAVWGGKGPVIWIYELQ